MEPSTAQNPVVAAEDKTVAILSYITIFGWIAALVIHSSAPKKTTLGAFHLRQVLGLIITSIALYVIRRVLWQVPVLGWLVLIAIPVIWLCLLVLWATGLIAAVNGQLKPIALLGPYYEKYLGTLFN
jgi:uncharacterized membrane protein